MPVSQTKLQKLIQEELIQMKINGDLDGTYWENEIKIPKKKKEKVVKIKPKKDINTLVL
jgi:hypothetical protein